MGLFAVIVSLLGGFSNPPSLAFAVGHCRRRTPHQNFWASPLEVEREIPGNEPRLPSRANQDVLAAIQRVEVGKTLQIHVVVLIEKVFGIHRQLPPLRGHADLGVNESVIRIGYRVPRLQAINPIMSAS